MDLCVTCGIFLFDWLYRPLPPKDYFYSHIRRAYFEKAVPELLPEIHRLLSKMNVLLKYMFEAKIKSVLHLEGYRYGNPHYEDVQKQLLELEWITTVQLFREHISCEDIDYLLVLIDECYMLNSETSAELWLGMILQALMKDLPEIHTDHVETPTATAAATAEEAAAEEATAKITVGGFICPREHMLARELFEEDDSLYI